MFEEERKTMIDDQLVRRGIIDKRVISAMSEIGRHLFVADFDAPRAYEDRPIHIDSGQTISQPYMVALMTQVLELKGNETILEIGTGSGYQTAILAKLGDVVYTIERVKDLKRSAEATLNQIGFGNINFFRGDGTVGWKKHAPYDRIIVTAAAPDVPESLFEQMKIGGRMVIPVGTRSAQELLLVLKQPNGKKQIINRGGCIFVPLLGKEGW